MWAILHGIQPGEGVCKVTSSQNEKLGRDVHQDSANPWIRERTRQSAVLATWADLIWLHAPRLSVRERLMEEAAMEKMIILVAILSIIVVASKLGRTISTARP
jgi:hypothetical protein